MAPSFVSFCLLAVFSYYLPICTLHPSFHIHIYTIPHVLFPPLHPFNKPISLRFGPLFHYDFNAGPTFALPILSPRTLDTEKRRFHGYLDISPV